MIFFLIFLSLFGIGFGVFLPGALILASIQSSIRSYFAKKKIKEATTLIAEYEAPNKLTPVEASYLYYGRYTFDTEKAMLFELQELGAVTVQLQKGSITFEKLPHKEPFHETYHQMFYDQLPQNGAFLSRTINPVMKRFIQIQLRDSLARQGYMSGKRYTKRVLITCVAITTVVAVLMGIGLAYTVMHPTSETGINYSINGHTVDHFDLGSAIGFGIGFAIWTFVFSFIQVLFAVSIYYRQLGIPVDATPKFKETWTQVLGFREYLKTVEQDNLQDDINTSQKTDQKLMAYAIGLNVVDI